MKPAVGLLSVLGPCRRVTCGVKDLDQKLVGVVGRAPLHSFGDVEGELVIPAQEDVCRKTCQAEAVEGGAFCY